MTKSARGRMDVVFIRKSTQGQEEAGQIANVTAMLKEAGTTVPKENWFVGTISRRKVNAHPEFRRLMELVEAGRIDTVYVESQDRWGTADRVELFNLLGILRGQKTRLYDLRAKRDLTNDDFATEIMAVMQSFKSEQELKDIAYRSLRSRVNNFKEMGSWPTGTHPFGYGKACYGSDGKLRWVWQPVSRVIGQLFYPASNGKLIAAGESNVPLPRKQRTDKNVLIRSNNPEFVEAVKLVFDLYTRLGLSRRKISAELNAGKRQFYDHSFTHTLVTEILRNPAYAGDTHFGKNRSGELYTFDEKGVVIPADKAEVTERRPVEKRIVIENTHEALIDRATWNAAQAKLKAEKSRPNYSPRNPAYFLKQILVCGHCGKGMTGRTDKDPHTGKRTVTYVCSSYVAGRCNGHPVECGYHRITHAEAEKMLIEKMRSLGLSCDKVVSQGARNSIKKQLEELANRDGIADDQWDAWLDWYLDDFIKYVTEHLAISDNRKIKRLWRAACEAFYDVEPYPEMYDHLPISIKKFKKALVMAETEAVKRAKLELAALEEDHRSYTLAQAKATSLQGGVLQEEIESIETKIQRLIPRTIPTSERLSKYYAEMKERKAENKRLMAEWPKLEAREKGEALRRHFSTVTLFWDRQFHPAAKNPARPRKTDRPGRFSYTLRRDQIKWALANSDLDGSW